MKILMRVDAGGAIGLGHYYRSMNLCQELKDHNHEIIITYLPSTFWSHQTNKIDGIQYFQLDADSQWEETFELISLHQPHVYYVDAIINMPKSFAQMAKNQSKLIFYQNITSSYDLANIFILPSAHLPRFIKPMKKGFYQGLQYLILNKKLDQIEKKNTLKNQIEHIAITAGGSDPSGSMLRVLEAITSDMVLLKKYKWCFYLGVDFVHRDEFINQMIPYQDQISHDTFDHESILQNDILIGAFGVSTFEFMYLGIPIIAFGHQDANADAASFLEQSTKSLVSIGNIHLHSTFEIATSLKSILADEDKLKQQAKNAQNIIDLKGAERVRKLIEKHGK